MFHFLQYFLNFSAEQFLTAPVSWSSFILTHYACQGSNTVVKVAIRNKINLPPFIPLWRKLLTDKLVVNSPAPLCAKLFSTCNSYIVSLSHQGISVLKI